MNSKTLALLCSLAVAAGCAADTNIAGTYEPSCIAFEGPGFPVRGTYVVEDDVVRLVTDVGELAGEMHLVRRPDQVYLLTGAEFESWQRDKAVPTCALLLGPGE
jgi:hypothetical protein